jgi:hypothetical protein
VSGISAVWQKPVEAANNKSTRAFFITDHLDVSIASIALAQANGFERGLSPDPGNDMWAFVEQLPGGDAVPATGPRSK